MHGKAMHVDARTTFLSKAQRTVAHWQSACR